MILKGISEIKSHLFSSIGGDSTGRVIVLLNVPCFQHLLPEMCNHLCSIKVSGVSTTETIFGHSAVSSNGPIAALLLLLHLQYSQKNIKLQSSETQQKY